MPLPHPSAATARRKQNAGEKPIFLSTITSLSLTLKMCSLQSNMGVLMTAVDMFLDIALRNTTVYMRKPLLRTMIAFLRFSLLFAVVGVSKDVSFGCELFLPGGRNFLQRGRGREKTQKEKLSLRTCASASSSLAASWLAHRENRTPTQRSLSLSSDAVGACLSVARFTAATRVYARVKAGTRPRET